MSPTFLDTFTDTIGLLEEVVVVALATAIQEVFASSCGLVVVPAWEGALTGSHERSHSAGICGGGGEATTEMSEQNTQDFSFTLDHFDFGLNEKTASHSLVCSSFEKHLDLMENKEPLEKAPVVKG